MKEGEPTTPSSLESRDAYNLWHGNYPTDVEADTPWHRLVKAHLDIPRDVTDKRMLEIGCGRGGFACWLADRSPPPKVLAAADFAHAAVVKGREFAHTSQTSRPAFEVGDIQRIPHGNERFDTVISCETVEHVPNPSAALKELARVLKPGGRLFLTTPNYLGTTGLYRVYMRVRGRRYTEEGQPINHVLFLPVTARQVRQTGMLVEKIDGVGHYLHVPRRAPVEIPSLDNPRWLMRWFGLHSLIVAVKPHGGSHESQSSVFRS